MMLDINASAMDRVMACAGSHLLEADIPDEEHEQTDAAKEGDAAHWCAVEIFKNGGELGKPGKKAANGWATDKDMWDYAADYVAAVMQRPIGATLKLETTAHWQATEAIRIRCKIDANGYDADTKTLYIDDFKYGWRPVEVEDNWQLIAYAIGVVRSMADAPPERVVLSIFQPRPFHLDGKHRSVTLTLAELAALHDRIIARLNNLGGSLTTGEHCTYCKAAAAGKCVAIRTASFNAVDLTTKALKSDITEEDHARELLIMQRAEKLLKQRVEWLEDLAVARMKKGAIIPGWTLKKSYGQNAWNSEKDLRAIAKETGVKLFDRVPVTPAEAIRRGVDEDMVKAHTTRPERGVKLVKGSSAKEAEKVFTK